MRAPVFLALITSASLCLALQASPQQARRKGVLSQRPQSPQDPWTKGKHAALVKAGWLGSGPGVWAKSHSGAELMEAVRPATVLFLETPHFLIASTLAAHKVKNKDKQATRLLRQELQRLAKRLPRLSPRRLRVMDPWLRVHLMAQRLEELYSDFTRVLGKGGARGMPDKLCIALFESQVQLERYSQQILDRASKIAIRDSLEDGTPLFAATAAAARLRGDRQLAGIVVFGTTHSLLSAYRGNHYALPVWLREGLAHYFAQRIDPRESNRTQGRADEVTMLQDKDWSDLARKLAKTKAMLPLSEIMVDLDFGKLRFRDHIACWSRVQYLVEQRPEEFGVFLQSIKGQTHKGASLRGAAVSRLFRKAFRSAFGHGQELDDENAFDKRWKAWLLDKKHKRRR